jgi:predicted phosphohydrolase
MKTYHFLSFAFCASTLISSTSFAFNIQEAKQATQAQKKQYKNMKALIRDIHDCWHAAQSKFVTILEETNYVPTSELVQVHAVELEAIRDRCHALEKFYDKNYSAHSSQENQG